MKKPGFKTVLFDFDYTLADASAGAISCVNFALDALGLPAAAPDEIRRLIGVSLPGTFDRLAGPDHAALTHEFIRLFHEQADRVMVDSAIIFDTVPGTLTNLRQSGLTLGIVSTKFRFRIEAILRREKLLDMFEVIIGGEDVAEHKPSPEGLLKAMDRLDNSPVKTLYVGDSVTDARTAQAAGVSFAAVLTGVTPIENFTGYPARGLLRDLSELNEVIHSL